MKKILIVISNLGIGGAQKSLISLLKSINYQKYNIDLLVLSHKDYLLTDIPDNVNLLKRNDRVACWFDNSLINCLKAAVKKCDILMAAKRLLCFFETKLNRGTKYKEQIVWKYTRKYFDSIDVNYDVAIAYCQGFPTYFTVEKTVATTKIVWMHSDISKQAHDLEYSLKYYKKYDCINCVSDKAAEAFCGALPEVKDKVRVFYNIVNRDEVLEKAEHTIEPLKDGCNIVTVGRLASPKGYDMAVKALKILVDKGYDVNWYVIGEGPERKNIESLIKGNGLEERFMLLGLKENPYPYVKVADIYAQTSIYEGYCITLAEAKALEKPIVTTNFSGADEQIINGENGLVVGMSPEEIAVGLEQLIVNKDIQLKFSKKLKDPNSHVQKDSFSDMIISVIK